MTNSKYSTARLLRATGTILFLIPSLAMAQPAVGKGKNARVGGDRRAPQGAKGSPDEIAAKMITEHDRNKDAELRVSELTAALAAQRNQRANGRGQNDASKGKRDVQTSGKQQQRRGPDGQKGTGKGSKRSQAQDGQRRPGGRGADPAQIAKTLIAEFDKNGSAGLDVQELVASIKTQRQNRSGKVGAEAGKTGSKGGRIQGEGDRRSRKGNSAEASQGKGPDQGRQERGNRKAEKDNTEPGTGVVPKRPGE